MCFSPKSLIRALFLAVALSLLLPFAGCAGAVDSLRERSARDAAARIESWNARKKDRSKPEEPPLNERGQPAKYAPEERAQRPATKPPTPIKSDLSNAASSPEFRAFLRELRAAVKNRDMMALAPMMTANFGYSLEPLLYGPGVFEYWDTNNIWPELEKIVREEFKPFQGFMVAPPKFADPTHPYAGYRAGIQLTPEGWRFAYFVTGL
ncbi:MAG: hypothetical protein SNJ52_02215 [Verrucomicrobiia bacterium]